MRYDHTVLCSTVGLELVGRNAPPVPIEVEFRYDTRDPYAVTAAFRTSADRTVEWCFARDLLADGMIAQVGLGDVCIGPALDALDRVVLVISSPAGLATFTAPADRLEDFIDRSYDLVLPGTESEWTSVDDALTGLLPYDLG